MLKIMFVWRCRPRVSHSGSVRLAIFLCKINVSFHFKIHSKCKFVGEICQQKSPMGDSGNTVYLPIACWLFKHKKAIWRSNMYDCGHEHWLSTKSPCNVVFPGSIFIRIGADRLSTIRYSCGMFLFSSAATFLLHILGFPICFPRAGSFRSRENDLLSEIRRFNLPLKKPVLIVSKLPIDFYTCIYTYRIRINRNVRNRNESKVPKLPSPKKKLPKKVKKIFWVAPKHVGRSQTPNKLFFIFGLIE